MRIDAILNPEQPHQDKLRNLPLQTPHFFLAHDELDLSPSLASCIDHNPRGRLITPTSSTHQATILSPDGGGGSNADAPNAFAHDDTFPDPPDADSFPSISHLLKQAPQPTIAFTKRKIADWVDDTTSKKRCLEQEMGQKRQPVLHTFMTNRTPLPSLRASEKSKTEGSSRSGSAAESREPGPLISPSSSGHAHMPQMDRAEALREQPRKAVKYVKRREFSSPSDIQMEKVVAS